MSEETWLGVLSRITAEEPVDLDESLFRGSAALPPAPARDQGALFPPPARLWERADTELSYLGVRVTEPLRDVGQAAVRLASAALERGVIPIILTTLPATGFEQFGFRVERIAGETEDERHRCEEEVSRFWDLAIVIDAADVIELG